MPLQHNLGPQESIRRLREVYGTGGEDPSAPRVTSLNIQFFIEGRDYGRGRIPAFPTDCKSERQLQYAFFCPKCGRLWASCPIMEQHYAGEWSVVRAICAAHEVKYCLPGSLWKSYLLDLRGAFTPEVWQRELALHLDYFERVGQSLYT